MAKQSLASYDADQYWTSRDFHTSARLHLQHWMWNYQLGYLLHPSVPKDIPDLKVAEVAAGNGAWTIELASVLPASAQLSGFDITASNYPAPEWLPSNVSMHVMDAFMPDLPEHLVGAFDIVHIRAFVTAVKDNAVEPLVKNLVKMLKGPYDGICALMLRKPCNRLSYADIFIFFAEPGGYLQWDESNPDTTTARPPRPEVSNKACTELLALLNRFGKMFKLYTESVMPVIPRNLAAWTDPLTGNPNSWLDDLPKTLQVNGMEVVDHAKFEPKQELSKAWTDDLLMVYEELQWNLPKAADAGPNSALTREMYQQLFGRVLKEAQEGVSLSMNQMVIVGRKRA